MQQFITLSSPERFNRYRTVCGNDDVQAVALYCWNMRVARSFYVYLQCWEVAFRNKMNAFLSWKYNDEWPYDESRCIRNMAREDKKRLAETRDRQQRDRKLDRVSTSMIVADLSAGFWVSQLSKPYNAHYAWKYNLARIFPHNQTLDIHDAWERSDGILKLRNRVAHHEPIHNLPLLELHRDLQLLVGAMCLATKQFADASCNFREVWELWHPTISDGYAENI